MKILLIYPKYPDTYWSFKHAMKFISKKAIHLPLGLVTISAMLPGEWKKKLVDLNVSRLKDIDIQWADYIMLSAMSIQTESVHEVIQRCRSFGKPVIAGGPLFTEEHEKFQEIDHFILNEAELTLPDFLNDMENNSLKEVYQTEDFADIKTTPVPDYDLIQLDKYATAGIQYSRGCPYDCEFCDVTALFGHRVRTKTPGQVLNELEALYLAGWRGAVFFVDDNFIGHKKRLKEELLPAIINWMKEKNHPFIFNTEASINLADDEELMQMMVKAGFSKVFVGIETPDENSLKECNKVQNNNRDLIHSVHAIQKMGIEVTAGFIVGFDNDPPSIFQRQIDFIQQSGIITAMVGLLNAPKLSKLYRRLEKEGRILSDFTGDNTDFSMNFIPRMDKTMLMEGYHRVVKEIYSGKVFYQRVITFLKAYDPPIREQTRINFHKLMAFFKSIIYLGIIKKYRIYYWRLLFWSLIHKPRVFPLAITYSIYGYHFRKTFGN